MRYRESRRCYVSQWCLCGHRHYFKPFPSAVCAKHQRANLWCHARCQHHVGDEPWEKGHFTMRITAVGYTLSNAPPPITLRTKKTTLYLASDVTHSQRCACRRGALHNGHLGQMWHVVLGVLLTTRVAHINSPGVSLNEMHCCQHHAMYTHNIRFVPFWVTFQQCHLCCIIFAIERVLPLPIRLSIPEISFRPTYKIFGWEIFWEEHQYRVWTIKNLAANVHRT